MASSRCWRWSPSMAIAGHCLGCRRLSDPAAARSLPRHGDLRARPHHLRSVGAMDEPDAGLHGLFRHPAARHRSASRSRTSASKLVCLIVILLIGLWISGRLRNSRFGRALRAISASEQGAAALGIRVSHYKLAAFVIAALYASAAGSLFAHVVGFISPEVFGPANGRGHVHHALCRRHRHRAGPGDRRRHCLAAAARSCAAPAVCRTSPTR